MATKTQLGGVFMKDTDGNIASGATLSTEFVCGLIFDTNGFGEHPLGEGSEAEGVFANGNVVELNSKKDLKECGITAETMHGLPYYHINHFFSVAGQGQRLFVSFMDSAVDTEFDAITLMQTAADGIIYQIGVWTAQPTNVLNEDVLEDSKLYAKLQLQAEILGGKIGVVNYDGNSPINIILNAPVVDALTFDYTKLPDVNSLELPKVTHILGQEASVAVHTIQGKLIKANSNKMVVVGNVGAALGVLAVAPAHMSIGYVNRFNLSGIMQSCELGFGNITFKDSSTEIAATSSLNNLKSIAYTKRNNYLHSKGYVFLTPIEGIQNGVFFSSDQTMTSGDYRTIARCRVMHKSRRVVRQALLAKVNSPVILNTEDGTMSTSDITDYQNTVIAALDNNMVEPGGSFPQISGRSCTIDATQNLMANDSLNIEYAIVPVGCAAAIFVTEGFAGSTTE